MNIFLGIWIELHYLLFTFYNDNIRLICLLCRGKEGLGGWIKGLKGHGKRRRLWMTRFWIGLSVWIILENEGIASFSEGSSGIL